MIVPKKIIFFFSFLFILTGCDTKKNDEPPIINNNIVNDKGEHVYPHCPGTRDKTLAFKCYDSSGFANIFHELTRLPIEITVKQENNQANVLLFNDPGFYTNIAKSPSDSLFIVGNLLEINTLNKNQDNLTIHMYSNFGDTFRDIKFVNDNLAFAVGGHSNIYRTQDGGLSWEQFNKIIWLPSGQSYDQVIPILNDKLYDLKFDGEMYSVDFSSEGHGVIVGEHGLIYSDNNGKNWERVKIDLPSYHALQEVIFSDNKNVWAVGEPNLVLHSEDSGKSWSKVEFDMGEASIHFMSIHFSSPSHGCMVGNNRALNRRNAQGELVRIEAGIRVFCTNDAGKTWVSSKINHLNEFATRLKMKNNLEGWMVSQGSIYHTANGGMNWDVWINFSTLDNSPLSDAAFWGLILTEEKAWAVGFANINNDLEMKNKLGFSKQYADRLVQANIVVSWKID